MLDVCHSNETHGMTTELRGRFCLFLSASTVTSETNEPV
jgi:hypothetical protein